MGYFFVTISRVEVKFSRTVWEVADVREIPVEPVIGELLTLLSKLRCQFAETLFQAPR
jgi:hypothetical protein